MTTSTPAAPIVRFEADPPHVLIVEARFYDGISEALLDGAVRMLEAHGATYDRVTVPGALELPVAVGIALEAADNGDANYDGYIVLGCVIRGETGHYDVVAREANRALMDLAADELLALGNGLLTVDNEEQAWERAKVDRLDKGGFAARACLDMIRLKRRFGL